MRLNKFIALATGMSRRAADVAITEGRVRLNGQVATMGQSAADGDTVTLDDQPIVADATKTITIMLNKPVGYVCSRNGQGSPTIYQVLSSEYHQLKPVGRLDKASSGLLLLTNDGQLANQLTHPSYRKQKSYEVTLDTPLQPLHRQMIQDHGIMLDDGVSQFNVERLNDDDLGWRVTINEGRNRQIRRTFAALGYDVTKLHRTNFGPYNLDGLATGQYRRL